MQPNQPEIHKKNEQTLNKILVLFGSVQGYNEHGVGSGVSFKYEW